MSGDVVDEDHRRSLDGVSSSNRSATISGPAHGGTTSRCSATKSGSANGGTTSSSSATASGSALGVSTSSSSATASGSAGVKVNPAPKSSAPVNPWNRFQPEHKRKGLSTRTMALMYKYEKNKHEVP